MGHRHGSILNRIRDPERHGDLAVKVPSLRRYDPDQVRRVQYLEPWKSQALHHLSSQGAPLGTQPTIRITAPTARRFGILA